MVAFYNQGDQSIYNKGQYFIPQEQYRLNYNPPVEEIEEQESSIGIPYTNSFTNFSNERNFTGSPVSLISDYQKTIEDRQQRLNNPSNTFLGFNTMRDQELTGADLGEYIGSNTAVPRELTTMGKIRDFISPQSAQSIMEEGYQEPRFQPGIIGTIMGKIDNYRNLPQSDQAFIAQNMGYTGPTVFGENASGLSKDVYGINTRSLFGNYADYVDNFMDQYKDMDDEEFNNLSKFRQQKINFYRQQQKELEALRKQEFDKPGGTGEQVANVQASLDRGGYDSTSGRADRDRSSVTEASAAASKGVGGGGYTASDSNRDAAKGRYMMGGLASL